MKTKNEIYAGWETYYQTDVKTAWKSEPEEFLTKNLHLLNGGQISVLDIASGDGRNSKPFFNQTLTCIDIAPKALELLRDECIQRKIRVPVLLAADFIDIQFVTSQFDVVQCWDGLPQMENTRKVIEKMISLTKLGGKIIFNFFTPNDVAYGEGEKIDHQTFLYKNTLFKFLDKDELIDLLPLNVRIIKSELKKWLDPPHGGFRPYEHTHEAVFILLERIN